MPRKYTLEEIKTMLKLGMIGVNNIKDVLICLKDLEYNAEIRNILVALTNNPGLPEEIRESLKEVIKANVTEITEEKENALVTDDNQPQVTVEEQPTQTVVRRPQVGVPSREEEGISLGNDVLLGAVVGYAANRGIKVLSSDPGIVKNGEISFELDNESKPYIDNLLLSLYDQMDDVKVGMKRIASSGKEVLTLSVDNPELSEAEIRQRSNEMFAKVNEILHNTDKNKDYEEKMDPKLRALKDKFHNDDPNIPNEDFEIGYSRTAGENTYYIIANSKEQAIEVAELMGYDIKEDRGGNVFEIEDEPNMTGSKLDEASTPVDYIDEVKDVDAGLTDIPVNYNDKHYGDNDYSMLESLTKSGKGEFEVYTPDATSNQRVVAIGDSTIVFDDGQAFDNYVSGRFQPGDGENMQMGSFDGTTTEYSYGNNEPEYTKSNPYVKTLGTYPTRNNQSANTNFFALVVFVLVLAIGFGVIYLIFGG